MNNGSQLRKELRDFEAENEKIEICRGEYNHLLEFKRNHMKAESVLEETIHDLNGKIAALDDELKEVTAERDAVAADRDRINKEFSEVCANYLKAQDELKYLSEEVNFMRGFKSAMEMALNGRM